MLLAAWLVIVPPEVTLALLLIFCVLAVLAVFLLAPLWIPLVVGVRGLPIDPRGCALAQPQRHHRSAVV